MSYPTLRPAIWPYVLPAETTDFELDNLRTEVDRIAGLSQYGWGHSINFGPFQKTGLLKEAYLGIAGAFDEWGWWPANLAGLRIADVGCFTGGLSLLMANRSAQIVFAVDEVPHHLEQCEVLVRAFRVKNVRPVLRTAYQLGDAIEPNSLDIILLSGVLYHMSDMLVGLYAMRELLKPGGFLLIQSHGIDDFSASYANFGRFVAGRWWQPTGLCIQDMLGFMGYSHCEVRFYSPNNCLARATKRNGDFPFKRGLNWPFEDLQDARPRSLDMSEMAPAQTLKT